MSKSHPVYTQERMDGMDGIDGMDAAPAQARSKKGIIIGALVAVAVVGGGAVFMLGGKSKETAPALAPAVAPASPATTPETLSACPSVLSFRHARAACMMRSTVCSSSRPSASALAITFRTRL